MKVSSYPLSLWIVFLVIAIVLSVPVSLLSGTSSISVLDSLHIFGYKLFDVPLPSHISQGSIAILWELRAPRTIMACLTGAGLAMTGLTLQTITRNNLAEPHLLGVSSGAVLGAVLVTLYTGEFLGAITLPALAFIGAMLASLMILALCRHGHLGQSTDLLMCGVSLSFVLMAGANFLLFSGDARASHQVIFWMLGGLGLSRWSYLWAPLLVVAASFAVLYRYSTRMNAFLLGDETATSLGIRVGRFRLQLFIISALLTAVLVANTGAIGFVGLMIPHIARFIVGSDITKALPVTALLGGIFLLWVDTLARNILKPEELPIGIITGFIGGLFFMWLLVKKH